ncbi:hypothetical protein D3C81_2194750 [compost metagenome]
METITLLKELSDVEPIGLVSASTNFSEGRMEEQGDFDHLLVQQLQRNALLI